MKKDDVIKRNFDPATLTTTECRHVECCHVSDVCANQRNIPLTHLML